MARFLLDTDGVIDYLKGSPGSVALIHQLHEAGETLCICDIVVAEVSSGLLPKDHAQGASFLDACDYLPTTLQMARQAGEWRFRHARSGITLATTDTLVTATAHGHQATVVTANTAHYPMTVVRVRALPRSFGRR